jgi:glycosyltransferase involved in cell wall biosynthesis
MVNDGSHRNVTMTRPSLVSERDLTDGCSLLQHRYGVVVYGRRDHYQVALALHEAGALERVFTDFYSPHWLVKLTDRVFPPASRRLRLRYHHDLSTRYFVGDLFRKQFLFHYWGWRGLTIQQRHGILNDHLSNRGARYAIRHPEVGMVCYSYYWQALAEARAARLWTGPGVVFQVHPVSSQIRRILAEDRERTGLSYSPEMEELLPPELDRDYPASLQYADGVIAASSFTARGLVEAGLPAEIVRVVPYGTGRPLDISKTLARPDTAGTTRWDRQSPLRLLWVGQLAYRKAPHHLFDAVRRFPSGRVEVTVVTRSAAPAELVALIPPCVRIDDSVSDEQLQLAYRTHHLFVLPSLVEGFGLVYMEALAEGLPILCTTNTGGPDVIQDGVEGFVVPPGEPNALVGVIETCLSEPGLLRAMSEATRALTIRRTWSRFRAGVRASLAAAERPKKR